MLLALALVRNPCHTLYMQTTKAPTLVKIEDHEGDGTCGACGREGLRWVATLSDDSTVGMECAKAVMGFKPAPKDYKWTADYRPVAKHVTGYGAAVVLWEHKIGGPSRLTVDGRLTVVGGAQARFNAMKGE